MSKLHQKRFVHVAFGYDENAMHCVRLVLWMTSCFNIICHAKRHEQKQRIIKKISQFLFYGSRCICGDEMVVKTLESASSLRTGSQRKLAKSTSSLIHASVRRCGLATAVCRTRR